MGAVPDESISTQVGDREGNILHLIINVCSSLLFQLSEFCLIFERKKKAVVKILNYKMNPILASIS